MPFFKLDDSVRIESTSGHCGTLPAGVSEVSEVFATELMKRGHKEMSDAAVKKYKEEQANKAAPASK